MVTAQDLINALTLAGVKARLVPVEPYSKVDGVNVWPLADPLARYPHTTVYEPWLEGPPPAEWTWGPNYEHRAPADIDLDTLKRAVMATLPEVGN